MKKFKIIVNPTSGRGAGEKAVPQIEKLLNQYKLQFEIVKTERPWHAAELAQKAVEEGFDVVVAAGGDGTANEVLNGLMQAKKTGKSASLGVLSVGRGNDFAFGVGIPVNLEQGCETLAHGNSKTIDVGLVTGGLYPGGRYFGNGIGIGFDAVVGFVASKMKHLTGFLSYIVAALKTIFLFFHAPMVQLEYNTETTTLPALMVSIMNGRRMGGGFMMAPDGKPDDGLLNLCIAKEVGRLKLFALMGRFMKGTQATHQAIITDQTKKIKITALEGILPAHSDGETLCEEGKELTVELLSSQLDILVF